MPSESDSLTRIHEESRDLRAFHGLIGALFQESDEARAAELVASALRHFWVGPLVAVGIRLEADEDDWIIKGRMLDGVLPTATVTALQTVFELACDPQRKLTSSIADDQVPSAVGRAGATVLHFYQIRTVHRVLGSLVLGTDRDTVDRTPRQNAIFEALVNHLAIVVENGRVRRALDEGSQLLERKVHERTQALENACEEISRLKNKLAAENRYLQEEIKTEHGFEEIIGSSDALRAMLGQVEKVARTPATVLILGESGTGKELVARAIHNLSDRHERPLVKVNCAALPSNLIESELFGHEKGAFTGAVAQKIGRFELAHGGTIFLDEIGELPLELQVKLLRVLQEQEIERIGGSVTIQIDARVIAATNRDLNGAVADGEFREDLFYRLNVFPVSLPALRQRKDDIPLLVRAFVERFSKRFGKTIDTIPHDVIEAFQSYSWPGNIRELQNVIERAVILAGGRVLNVDEPLDAASTDSQPLEHVKSTLEEVERRHITRTLEEVNGKISGEGGAAEVLDMNPSTLRARMRKLGIERFGSK